MLAELIPTCPRLHPGMMVPDDPKENVGREWVCRICGTRLYAIGSNARVAQVTYEKPMNENTGNHTGKPRHKLRCGCMSDAKHVHRRAA